MIPRKLAIGVVLLIAVAGAAAYYHFVLARPRADGNVVRVSGNIEVVDAEVSFKIPGRVVERLVDEGQKVEQGQVVAVLDDSDLRAELAARQAELEAAQAALAELEQGSRPEEKESALASMQKAAAALKELEAGSRPQQIKAAKATYDSAKVEKDRLESELARAVQLLDNHTISQEAYDRQKAAYQVAAWQLAEASANLDLVNEGPRREQIEQASEALKQAQAQYKLVMEGARKEVRDQAKAKVKQAAAAVRLAETRLSYTKVTSPLDGIVLSKQTEPGEYVAAGTPIVTVADLKNVWLRAYLDEPYLDLVKFGQTARITTATRQNKSYEGRVSFISAEAEFTPKNVQTEKERTKLVYRIKIDVDNTSGELKRGMPADAEIFVNSASSASSENPSTQADNGKSSG